MKGSRPMRLKDSHGRSKPKTKRQLTTVCTPILLMIILTVLLTACGMNSGTAARIGIMVAAVAYAVLECRAIYHRFKGDTARSDTLTRLLARTVGNGNNDAAGCALVYACIRGLFAILFLIAAMSCFEATAIAAEMLMWLALLCLVTLAISIPVFCVHNRRGDTDR